METQVVAISLTTTLTINESDFRSVVSFSGDIFSSTNMRANLIVVKV